MNNILAPIQAAYAADPEWQELAKKAYPPPPASEKKQKKPKDKGSKYPGGVKNATAQPDGSVQGEGSTKASVGENVDEAMQKLEVKE